MTGNPLIDVLISIGGILVMVLAARLVFPAPRNPITREWAGERIAFEEPDFVPQHWLLDAQGRAALAEGAGGEFILVERLGLDLTLRRFFVGQAKAYQQEGALIVKLPDLTMPKAVINNADASQWIGKLLTEGSA